MEEPEQFEEPSPKQLADLVMEVLRLRRAEIVAGAVEEAERRKVRAEYLADQAKYRAKVARMRALELERAAPINTIEKVYLELLRRGLVPDVDQEESEADTPDGEDDPFGDEPVPGSSR